jgi:hypothetical protein
LCLNGAKAEAYHFIPKGLNPGRRYRLTYDSSGQTREVDGGYLVDQGVRVAVKGTATSELLLFETL